MMKNYIKSCPGGVLLFFSLALFNQTANAEVNQLGEFVADQTASTIIQVPDNYSTIQEAIDAAPNNSEILVKNGIYYENINFKGKTIYLHSQNGPVNTIIDGQERTSVVTLNSDEGNDTILDGFRNCSKIIHAF